MRYVKVVGFVATLFFLGMILKGCTWNVYADTEFSEAANDLSPVFLTVYAQHTRIALPRYQEGFVEFGFGDWSYYALGQKGFWSSLRAAFFASPSALSRRELSWNTDPLDFQLNAGGERSALLWVDSSLVQQLLDKLEDQWESLQAAKVFREEEGLGFAKWDRPYYLFKNCNYQTAEWLRQLGLEVRGWTLLSQFNILPR